MKLSVLERVVSLSMLPQKGSFTNIKLLRVVREDLSFDETENSKLKFVQGEASLTWNLTADVQDKDITFGEVVSQMLIKELKKLDEEEAVEEQHFSLYEKLIGGF